MTDPMDQPAGGFDFSVLAQLSGDLTQLNDEERRELAELVAARIEYNKLLLKCDELKLAFLSNPTREAQEAYETFAELTLRPKREEMLKETLDVLRLSVNSELLVKSLPMLLAVFVQAVNIPLLLNAVNVDPTQVKQAIEGIQKAARGELGKDAD